ncbi:MAG: hypothetical protein KKD33_00835, partial [Verrucomicrobia bacterium]|nr:hypothetical protein [Verrucomicrobiota bacterium]
MKRTGYLLAMAAVVFFVGKVCYAEENLIKNYSFEEWTAENPTDWKVNLKEAKVVKSETEQIEGKSSLCLKLSPSGDGKGKASG